MAIADISAINPAPPPWTGSFSLNGLVTSGNSETEQVGFRGALSKRWPRDRLTFGAEYTFGRQEDPDTGDKSTTVDYAMGLAKYDHFFTGHFYGYLSTKVERDGVADLEVRVAPGTGVGYQWFEGRTFNLSNEARRGVGVRELQARQDEGVLRTTSGLFGRLDSHRPAPAVPQARVHPELQGLLGGDYLLNIDAGARLAVWKGLFAELRYEYPLRLDARPPAVTSTDQRYILGAGWSF